MTDEQIEVLIGDAYDEGRVDGFSEGYDEGYCDGKDEGYEEGYAEGYDQGYTYADQDNNT